MGIKEQYQKVIDYDIYHCYEQILLSGSFSFKESASQESDTYNLNENQKEVQSVKNQLH